MKQILECEFQSTKIENGGALSSNYPFHIRSFTTTKLKELRIIPKHTSHLSSDQMVLLGGLDLHNIIHLSHYPDVMVFLCFNIIEKFHQLFLLQNHRNP